MRLYDNGKLFRYRWGMADGGNRAPDVPSLPRAGLGRLRVAMNVTFAQASRETGLSEQQAELLCAAMVQERSIGDLARVLHCDQSNVSRMVDRATKNGLLYRRGGKADGRVTVVELTQKGKRLALRFISTLESKIEPLLDEWSDERQRAAVDTLSRIAETLEASQTKTAAPEPPPPGAWVVGE
jgi:DNA-binding MarR family transcriptional regulator